MRLLAIGLLTALGLWAQSPPTNVSVSPSSGSGLTQTFTMVSSSSAGWQNIAWQEIVINYGIDAGGACYFLVYPQSQAVYIVPDTGWTYGGWAGSGTIGSAGTIQNSQCQLNLAASSVSGSGDNVSTTLALTFLAGLPGPQNVYTIAGDNAGLESSWQQMGTWTTSTVTSQPPTLISATPSAGTGLTQTFSYTASSVNGSRYLTQIGGIINSSLTGLNGCYFYYFALDNSVYLLSDDETRYVGGGGLGLPGTVSNSQCTIDMGASSAVASGNNLTLNLAVTFNANWAGTKNTWLYALDRQLEPVGWTDMGSWKVEQLPAYDPRRTGVQTSGSYWGGGGEQIDTLSGNLNFTIPLLKPQGRSGPSVPINLSYNSQNWEQQNGANIQTGHDVGYGFGWQMQIGSIVPVYVVTQGATNLDHYLFTDGSGAQYSLYVNVNNVWSSTQGIYIWFDANANKIHFRDGSWWLMGCTSSSGEMDAGTMYPTLIEDVDGNEIVLQYLTGAGAGSVNTSARINFITTPETSMAIRTTLTGSPGTRIRRRRTLRTSRITSEMARLTHSLMPARR